MNGVKNILQNFSDHLCALNMERSDCGACINGKIQVDITNPCNTNYKKAANYNVDKNN